MRIILGPTTSIRPHVTRFRSRSFTVRLGTFLLAGSDRTARLVLAD